MTTRARARRQIELGGADLDLIRRCLNGDAQAWADLYLRYRTPLYALSLSWTHDHASAEDVVHDAFVRAFEQMRTFDQERRFFPWLAAIAKNCFHDINRYRRGRVQVEMPDDAGNGGATDSTIEAVIDFEERARVQKALAALPDAQRTALLLAELEGLSYAEVARSVGASESAVKSLIFRARAMLRQSLKPMSAILGLRAFRQRLAPAARRLTAIGARFQLEASLLECVGLCVATAAVTVVLLGSSGTTYASRLPEEHVVGTRGSSGEGMAAVVEISIRSVRAVSRAPARFRVDPSITIGDPEPGRPAPSSGTFSLQVVGPGGRVVYQNSTGFRCDGQGAGLLPDRGPVRAAC
jgi:RNA polymerase sigma-70 factor (ECF subfamily)